MFANGSHKHPVYWPLNYKSLLIFILPCVCCWLFYSCEDYPMRSLDELFDTMQSPIAPLMDWSDSDKDFALAIALTHLKDTGDAERLKDSLLESLCGEDDELSNQIRLIGIRASTKRFEDFHKSLMISLYSKLEHIINDRINYYNAS